MEELTRKIDFMSRNITSAAKYLRKEIARLEKEALNFKLIQSIAKEGHDKTVKDINDLKEQLMHESLLSAEDRYKKVIEELEPKTAYASL